MYVITRQFVAELHRRLNQKLPFIQVVLGPRQVGKTTGVLKLGKESAISFYYASADLPAAPGLDWVREQWNTARVQAENKPGILAIDEIQKIAGWSEMVKSLFDEERRRTNPLQVILLGSASWTIQQGLTETLAGRFELIRVPHWGFEECKRAFNWNIEQFLKFGGYPAPVELIHEESRWQQFIRDSIVEPMLSRDLLTLRDVAKPALFRQLLQLALSYPAQEMSLQKLLGQLQDKGNATTIKGYLELLEAGFVLKILPKYTTRPITTKSSSPKILPLSPALIHAFTPPIMLSENREWYGRVFESAIGAQLAQIDPDICYWREGNNEVDFVVNIDRKVVGIEVKSGRKKRNTGLEKFRAKFPDAKTLVINSELGEYFLGAQNPVQTLLDLVCNS